MIPIAHVGGIPVEETLGSFGPALLLGLGVAWAKLRARLRRVRSRPPRTSPAQEGGDAVRARRFATGDFASRDELWTVSTDSTRSRRLCSRLNPYPERGPTDHDAVVATPSEVRAGWTRPHPVESNGRLVDDACGRPRTERFVVMA